MIRRKFLALLGALPFAAIFGAKAKTVTLAVPNLFPTSQPLQGFSVDDVFEPGWTPADEQGCDCVSTFTERLRAEKGDQIWTDHVYFVLQNGKTHTHGRFTVTIYENGYPDKSARKQYAAAYCPICGSKYPEALEAKNV